jgi:hypothetical protein
MEKRRGARLSITDAFANARRPAPDAERGEKKNYAERLSRQLARVVADELRSSFPGILPDEKGKSQESKARTSKGFKKLDVNYSTLELGLALGVSIKTINFPDRKTKRYTKNYTRAENELRAEATDYHTRQPWAVLVAIIFLPVESCDDANPGPKGEQAASSFGSAVRFFRNIHGRRVDEEPDRFEAVFIGLYEKNGRTRFFDVSQPPPKKRRPADGETVDLSELTARIRAIYDNRNSPPFRWADDPEVETTPLQLEDDAEDEPEP